MIISSYDKMKIKNVLLINLPEEGQCADFYTPRYAIDSFSVYPPLGLLYVATAIKDEYPVEVLDVVAMQYNIAKTSAAIIDKAPSVLGISCQTFRLYPLVQIIKRVKDKMPKLIVIVGGPHTSLYPEETLRLPGVDYVIVGDGEIPMKMLLDAIRFQNKLKINSIPGLVFFSENGIVKQNPKSYVPISSIKIPDRSFLNYKYYYTAADQIEQVVTMISSRGCPFHCTFCDVQEKQYRYRDPNDVVDEMEQIAKTFTNPIIHIFDDTFNFNKERVINICNEIIRRKLKINWTTRARVHPFDEEMVAIMKIAGVKRVHFGVESGSETTLLKIKKGVRKDQVIKSFELCQKYGIDTLAYFIIGFDWESPEDINNTIAFTRSINATFIMANTLYPAAKTDIYKDMLNSGSILKDYWLDFATKPTADFKLPIYRHPINEHYLRRKLDEIYLSFYLSPRFIINNFKTAETKSKNTSASSGLLFKINLSFLIVKSYLLNLIIEYYMRLKYIFITAK